MSLPRTFSPVPSQSVGTGRPVFIHAAPCQAYEAEGFPESLRALPLAFEARASGSRVTALSARQDVSAEAQMRVLFDECSALWLQLRHAEAGCFIARVDRVTCAATPQAA